MLGASPFGVPVISPDQVNCVRPGGEAGTRLRRARVANEASSGSDLVFVRLDPEQVFQLLELVRVLGGDVVVLCPVLGEIVQFVRVTSRILR